MPRNAFDYEQDFFAWTEEQAKLLRQGDFSKIDTTNLAEEIESVGRRERREVSDRLENLIAELLKWRVERGARCGNWRSAINHQRFEIEAILDDSPSLRQYTATYTREAYSEARERVIEELRLLNPDFPAECPFTAEQILAEDFLPED